MYSTTIGKALFFLFIIGCLLAICVHAKTDEQNEEEENEFVETAAGDQAQAKEKTSEPHPAEGNINNFDEIFKDPEISALLESNNFDIDDLLKILKRKGIELPTAPPKNDDDSSFYRHSDLSHADSDENISDMEKSEI